MSEESEWNGEDSMNEGGKIDSASEEEKGKQRTNSFGRKPDDRRRMRRVNFDQEGDEIDQLATYERVTENGGYMHTKNSRMKISLANKGKCPWNKGKNRSEGAKANISAGVRARNHALLLLKLEKLGMSEEEWFIKKRQIKLLRERVRKSKVAAAKHMEAITMESAAGNKPFCVAAAAEPHTSSRRESIPSDHAEDTRPSNISTIACTQSKRTDKEQDVNTGETATNENEENPSVNQNIDIFARDIKWIPHTFDADNISYDVLCPHGGPGGLICCSSCTLSYSKYLDRTYDDIETQKMTKVGEEVKELLRFTRDAKDELLQTTTAARKKPVPLRRNPDPTATRRKTDPTRIRKTTDQTLMEKKVASEPIGKKRDSKTLSNSLKDPSFGLLQSEPVERTVGDFHPMEDTPDDPIVPQREGPMFNFSDEEMQTASV